MAEGEKTYLINLSGKELKVVTGKVKGRIQDHIRNTHKFHNAQYLTYRTEGCIRVDGVPEAMLREALQKAQSNLLPEFRFTFDISEPKEDDEGQEAENGGTDTHIEEEIGRRFQIGMEQAQREWGDRVKGYEAEISRLTGEMSTLEGTRDQLIRLNDQEKERNASLQRSYSELSSLVSRLSAERVRPPVDAGRLWVGDWSRVAERFEDDLRKAGFSGKAKDVPETMIFDTEALRTAVRKLLPSGADVPTDLVSIEEISKVRTWEDTDAYRSISVEYRRAKTEADYVDSLASGKIHMPDSLRENFMKSVDLEGNRRIITQFEAREKEYHLKNAAAGDISVLVQRHRTGEALRSLRATMSKEKPLPAILLCHRPGAKWVLELLLPSSKGLVRATYTDCIEKVAEEIGLKDPEFKESENLVSAVMTLSGNVTGWKDASKKQEQFAAALTNSFRGCPLQALGVHLRMTKMMDVPPSTEKMELKPDAHSAVMKPAAPDQKPV